MNSVVEFDPFLVVCSRWQQALIVELQLVLALGCCMEVALRTGWVLVHLGMDRTGRSTGVVCCLDRGLNAVGSWDQLVEPCLKDVDIPWHTPLVEHRHPPGRNLGLA